MFDQLKVMFKMLLADDELFDLNAKLYAKMKQSLMDNGFTEEGAEALVRSQKMIGSAPQTQNTTDEQ